MYSEATKATGSELFFTHLNDIIMETYKVEKSYWVAQLVATTYTR